MHAPTVLDLNGKQLFFPLSLQRKRPSRKSIYFGADFTDHRVSLSTKELYIKQQMGVLNNLQYSEKGYQLFINCSLIKK